MALAGQEPSMSRSCDIPFLESMAMVANVRPEPTAPVVMAPIGAGPLMPAAAQLMIAAWQRNVALQAEWIEDSLRRARDHREVPALQRPVTDWSEPALRYLIGLMALGRSTQDQLVCLTSASLRGAQGDLDRLTTEARQQASQASEEAGCATQSAWSCWMQGLRGAPTLPLMDWPGTNGATPPAPAATRGARNSARKLRAGAHHDRAGQADAR